MKYMGSKARIAKDILPIMKEHLNGSNYFVDAFCGGCNLIDKLDYPNRIANDNNKYLIGMWNEILRGITFARYIDREAYCFARDAYKGKIGKHNLSDGYIGWIGFTASFNGKFFNGYSGHNVKGRDYIGEQIRNILKQEDKLKGVKFTSKDYKDLDIPKESVLYCFDKDTEILTKDGWKLLKDSSIDDMFLSRCPEKGTLEYVDAIRHISYPYKGSMYQYIGKEVDLLVTPNHRIFCAKSHSRARIRKNCFIPAKDFYNQNAYFISAGGKWHGSEMNNVQLCEDTIVPSDKFAYLLGVFLTDGCINNQDNVTISQTKKHVVNKLINCLDELGLKYTISKTKRGNGYLFYLSRKYKEFFKQFYLKEQRKVPMQFKNATLDILDSLMDGILDGDSDTDRRRITIGSKTLVDDIMEIAYKIGKSASYKTIQPKTTYYAKENRYIKGTKPYYIVSIKNKKYIQHSSTQYKNEKWIDYDDMVYCVTLSKYNTVLVRRNGKAIWCGQCDPPYKNTTQYPTSKNFNHEEFWQWCRDMTKQGHKVFVSEYQAPEDFTCLWEKQISNSLNTTKTYKPIEKLFTI